MLTIGAHSTDSVGAHTTVAVSHATSGQLGPGLQLARLLTAAASADGHAPFGEHVLLTLDGQTQVEHALIAAHRHNELVGFLVLSETTSGTWYAELVTSPSWRRQGTGTQLLQAARDHVAGHGGGRLRTWAHDGPAGRRVAARLGMTLSRVLLHQEADLTHPPMPLPPLASKPGVQLRTLRAQDSEDWLHLSNAAFLGHPENGGWTHRDLDWRLAAPWTDLERFIVAVDDHDRLLAGVWTKVEPGSSTGELYVVAVHPEHTGQGLGRQVVHAALTQLRALGLSRADLYVDQANRAACQLYASVGFTTQHTDRCYDLDIANGTPRRPAQGVPRTPAPLEP